MWHHFWFLDITLDSWHLRTLCTLVVAAMLPAALLPGLLYSGGWVRALRCCFGTVTAPHSHAVRPPGVLSVAPQGTLPCPPDALPRTLPCLPLPRLQTPLGQSPAPSS